MGKARKLGGLHQVIADNVRRHRKARKGLSQEKLAALCGYHRTYVGMIERGERNITIATLEALAGALGVEPLQLGTVRSTAGRHPSCETEKVIRRTAARPCLRRALDRTCPTSRRATVSAAKPTRGADEGDRPRSPWLKPERRTLAAGAAELHRFRTHDNMTGS